MSEKISIIVPIYKVEAFIRSCIDSLLVQTYKNLEIILVDDGSPDKSGKICDEYASLYSNVRVFHQPNSGVTAARKTGVEQSTGEWILFVDGDDELTVDAAEKFIELANSNNAQMVVTPETHRGRFLDKTDLFLTRGSLSPQEFAMYISIDAFNVGIGGKFWKKDLYYEGVLNTDNKIKNNEDYVMNLLLSEKMQSVYCEPKVSLYIVKPRPNSASRTKLPKENWMLLYNLLLSISNRFYGYPALFILTSIMHRLNSGEISIPDIYETCKHIECPDGTPKYFYRLKQAILHPSIWNNALYKVSWKIFQMRSRFLIYGMIGKSRYSINKAGKLSGFYKLTNK